ncbi:UDP-glucose 4-epimerase GalE [Anaerococcus vaginalis]|uniref:UDP-glucose 4-epimerase GalE n=1 Tax=Anaerococcus vaginalis TaxID=33037 RepID=UPI00291137A9|nr:UDP-glucose 4-epimerase GalE [Anaerococcus vaginalis]MDU5373698.1 UDP-glucose 4-epimerase GalE [Anaerococcus vaginalis]
MKNVLITGGAGYIGSHVAVELLNKNYKVIVYDNLTNSSKISVKRVEEITGKNIIFYEADILDEKKLSEVFEKENIDVVIHCAALKAVGESVKKPLEYYHNNISGTLSLLKIMRKYSCKNIIFSSSATVYGDTEKVPITEDFPKGICTNPYGWTKSMMEQIMTDLQKSDPEWKVVLLRYFNPIGAHESGKIGEDPQGIPNNLLPYIAQVAVGKLDYLRVFGDDYDTVDGTGVRDYIHVVDLAKGHVLSVDKIDKLEGVSIINLATGNGYSVLEVLKAFEKACGKKISYKIVERREGDIAKCFADASKAYEVLGWKAEKGIDEMCEDSWRWQSQNPNGYEEKE